MEINYDKVTDFIMGLFSVLTPSDEAFESYIQMMYYIFFLTIMCMGVIGNMMVIIATLMIKHLRNSTNIFLANLSIADIIFLFAWGTGVLLDANSDSKLNDLREGLCHMLPFTEAVVMNVSVLTILAICFERHFAVCQPLRSAYIWTKNKAFAICIATWTVAVLLSFLPISFTLHLQMWHSGEANVTQLCNFSDGHIFSAPNRVISETAFFFLSITIVLLVYILMAQRLKGAVAPSVNNIAIRERRRRVIRMFATVTFCFIILQLPYRVFSLLPNLEQTLEFHWYNIMSLICRTLLYLHSAVNPILYTLMSKQFRKGFKNICCFCVRTK